MSRNLADQDMWGSDAPPNIENTFRSCLGYANSPGWLFIKEHVNKTFGEFGGLRTIELGSGLGKVSILFALLGAEITLVDYSDKQLSAAKVVHDYFATSAQIKKDNIFSLPKEQYSGYDIAMSFGTAEHFLKNERQSVFDSHAGVLKHGGLAILWVPNRYGVLFHLGRTARRVIGRGGTHVVEKSFTRRELRLRATAAGLADIHIQGGERLRNDFSNHIFNTKRFSSSIDKQSLFSADREENKKILRQHLIENKAPIKPWSNFFSYPLVLIARHG